MALMPRRVAGPLLLLLCAAVLLSQLRLLPQDQGLLLAWAGRPVDGLGRLQGRWQRLVRDCSAVEVLAPGSAPWQQARAVLAAYSPPASETATLVQLLAMGQGEARWLLAEVHWPPQAGAPAPALDPAIVPLRLHGGGWQVQPTGVWSGDTGPWFAPLFIRGQLARRLPALPAPLRDCLDPRLPVFGGETTPLRRLPA